MLSINPEHIPGFSPGGEWVEFRVLVEARGDPLDLFDCLSQRPRRVNGVIGVPKFLFPGHLRADLPQGGRPADSVPFAKAPDLFELAAMDDDHSVEMPGVAGLDRQGGLGNEDPDAALAFEPAEDPFLFLKDERVEELVEEAAGRGVGKNHRGEPGPVDRPVLAQDVPAEAGDDFLPRRPAGRHQVMGRLVGGVDEKAFFFEEPGDDGLAAGDPPRQGDAKNARSSWPSFSRGRL